jgi:hypothetical protein
LNRYRAHPILWLALLAVTAVSPSIAGALTLPNVIRTAASAEIFRPQIKTYVNTQVAGLSGTATAQHAARESLIDTATAAPTPSASFMDVYADELNQALLALADSPDVRVRLNAAVANAEVAQRAGNARLAPVTAKFMADKAEAIAMWGLKAARFIIPVQLSVPAVMRQPNLLPLVIGVVKTHPDSAPVVEEAYLALTLNGSPGAQQHPSPDIIAELTPKLLELLAYRATLYGDTAAADPAAEDEALVFLTRTAIWHVQTPPTQQQIMDDIYALAVGISKFATQPEAVDHEELINQLKRIGRAFQVIADQKASDPLRKAAAEVAEISRDTPAADIQKRLDDLGAAIKSP